MKIAKDYSGLNFQQLLDLDIFHYRELVRDAFVYTMKQTPEGREYLENCYLLTQTQPDRQALRSKFTGGEN